MDTIFAVGVPDGTSMTDCFDKYPSKCPHAGMDATFLYSLLFHAGFRIQWIKAANYTEAGELLQSGLATMSAWMDPYDGSILAAPVTQNLTKIYALQGDKAFFVYRKRERSVFQHVILSGGFRLPIWALLAVSGGLCYTLVVSFKVLYRPKVKKFRDLDSVFLCWGIVTNVILNTYGNLLTIVLYTHPKDSYKPFKNLAELAEKLSKKQCHLMATEPDMYTFPMFFPSFTNYTTDDPQLREVAKAFELAEKANSHTTVSINISLRDYAELLTDSSHHYPDCLIMVTISDTGYYFMWQESSKFIVHVEPSIVTNPYAYFYNGKSKALQERITTSLSTDSKLSLRNGILADFYRRQDPKSNYDRQSAVFTSQFERHTSQEFESLPLSMQQMVDAVCLLLGGDAISILIMVLERWIYHIEHHGLLIITE